MDALTLSQYENSTEPYDNYYRNKEPPFDPQIYYVIENVIRIAIIGIISLCGMIANIINLIVFSRIGILSDSSTVSLTGLAISDFLCCFFVFWSCICLGIFRYFNTTEYRWDVWSFYLFSSLFPRHLFTQSTCWLTVYIALERFVAIVFPFKVKYIFTPKHSLFAVLCTFILLFALHYQQYFVFFPQWVYFNSSSGNTSILTFVPPNTVFYFDTTIEFIFLCLSLRMLSFVTVFICNMTMVRKLTSRKFITTKFDESIANNSNNSSRYNNKNNRNNSSRDPTNNNKRDKRLIRMMSLICALFIISLFPDICNAIVFVVLPLYTPTRHHWFVGESANTFCYLLETINSSSNIFIYYTLNSRYRKHLQTMCRSSSTKR